jgi:flagellum-specific peptidoglycan hydrolase FlgJ
MAQDLFGSFIRGWDFIEGVQDREQRRRDLDTARGRQDTLWQQQQEQYQDAQKLKRIEDMARRYEAIRTNPDGSRKSFEQIQQEGNGAFLYQMWNDSMFDDVRNLPGKDVKVVNAYGRGDKMMLEAEWRNPETGEVMSRGAMTAGRTNDKNDPVREYSLDQVGKWLEQEFRSRSDAYAKKWQGTEALNTQQATERKVLDTLGATGGEQQGAMSGGIPPKNAAEFAQRMIPAAVKAAGGDQEEALVMTAQAALETGWGKSAPGNNYFGIKGGTGPQLSTTEVDPFGNPYSTKAAFRQYGSLEESAAGRQQFLTENPRYAKAGYFAARTAEEKADALQRAEYATDPQYAAKLKAIIATLRSSSQAGRTADSVGAPAGTSEAPRKYPDPASPRGTVDADSASAVSSAPSAPPFDPGNPDLLQGVIGYALGRTGVRPATGTQQEAATRVPQDLRDAIDKAPEVALRDPKWFVQNAAQVLYQNPSAIPQQTALPGPAPSAVASSPVLGERPIDPNRPVINNPGGTILTGGTDTSSAAPSAQPVAPPAAESTPVPPRAKRTAAENAALRDHLFQLRRLDPQYWTLDRVQRVMKTGELSEEKLHFVNDGVGGYYAVDNNTGLPVHRQESEMGKAYKEVQRQNIQSQIDARNAAHREDSLKLQKLQQEIGERDVKALEKAVQLSTGLKDSDPLPPNEVVRMANTAKLYRMDLSNKDNVAALIRGRQLTSAIEKADESNYWAIPFFGMNLTGQDRKFLSYSVGMAAGAAGIEDPDQALAEVVNPAMAVAKQFAAGGNPSPQDLSLVLDYVGGARHRRLGLMEAKQAAELAIAAGIRPDRFMKMFDELAELKKPAAAIIPALQNYIAAKKAKASNG